MAAQRYGGLGWDKEYVIESRATSRLMGLHKMWIDLAEGGHTIGCSRRRNSWSGDWVLSVPESAGWWGEDTDSGA